MSKLRFDLTVGVGHPGKRSAAWRVFARRGSEDVFVTCSEFGSSFKISLHPSGRCHAAFRSAEEHEQASTDWSGNLALQSMPKHMATGTRELPGRFHRAWEMVESQPGLSTPLHIAVPADSLSRMSSKHIRPARMLWIDPTLVGTLTLVSVVFTRDPLPAGHWPGKGHPGTTLLGTHSFPSGRTVWVLGSMRTLTEADTRWLTECASVAVEPSRLLAADRADTEIPRVILPCLDHALGTLALWDVERRTSGAGQRG